MGDFFSSEDGQCYDDMNAMLWQLYFNVAMKSDLEAESGPPLPVWPLTGDVKFAVPGNLTCWWWLPITTMEQHVLFVVILCKDPTRHPE